MTRVSLIAEMDEKLRLPGVTNIWTQPIKNRIDMLSTGVRSQVGIKIFGNDLKTLEELSRRIAKIVFSVHGAKGVYAGQISGAAERGRARRGRLCWRSEASNRAAAATSHRVLHRVERRIRKPTARA